MEKETTRQLKVARQIQKDISDIFIKEVAGLLQGVMASVTVVRVSPDLSFVKIYLSIFPFERSRQVMDVLEKNNWMIRKALGTRIKHQLKLVPEIAFMLDDSLEYIENIEGILKND
jgi:ribosome-binding factor A